MWKLIRRRPSSKHRPRHRYNRFSIERLEERALLSGTPPTVVDLQIGSTQWTSAFTDYLNSQSLGDDAYRIPVGSTAQNKSLPWINLDQISIAFGEDVDIQSSDLSISGINAPAIQVSHFFYDAFNHVATWTLSAPLPRNVYQIDLDGNGSDPVADLDGNALDGEWTNNSDTFSSGDGTAGGDFAFTFRVLPADLNQNNGVEYVDLFATSSRQGITTTASNYLAVIDLDGDGEITSADTQAVQAALWTSHPTGSPVGVANDAPTTSGGATVSISNAAVDAAMSLWDAFSDAETADSSMSYSVVSNSDPSLFDSVSVNTTNGTLVLNAAAGKSGRSELIVMATDATGLCTFATFYADVMYVNQPPVLNYVAISEGYDTWLVCGTVSDPDDVVEGMIVEFHGAFEARATVRAGGVFEFAVIVEQEHWSYEVGYLYDWHGLVSNAVTRIIGVT